MPEQWALFLYFAAGAVCGLLFAYGVDLPGIALAAMAGFFSSRAIKPHA